ncbi:hyalin-like [Amphiura filiformis]|uniref:hyalin-like n=1 Tax=Amphiura filiformis TaxID=82378 RepID=UPI003B21EC50
MGTVDRIPPVCECGEDITRTIPLNVGGASIVFTECTATDNSGTVSLENRSHAPGQRFTTGTTEVMYEFSDPSNNRVSCSIRISVIEVDDVPPVCIPSNDVTETIDLGQFGRTVTFPEPRATDNSGTANLQSRSHSPGAFFQVGSTEVCYIFADEAGNSADCCFNINIIEVDTVPPNPNCPRDVARTTACNSGGTIEVTWQPATATDNSGTANLVSQSHRPGQSFFPVGQTTVTYTFSDPSDNRASCDFVVTVTEVSLGAGGTTINYNEPRATDDCGPATLQSRSHAPGEFFNTGRTSVIYIFVDGSGNTVSCAFNVQVNEVDRDPPVCECGEDITRTIPLPQVGGVGGTNIVFTECTATDNSGTVSLEDRSHTPGQRFTTGTTEVMYEFSDPSNNRVSCSFRITVIEVDDQPPVCIPTNDVTETIDLGQFGRTVTFPEPRATDNSGTANLQSRSHTPGVFFQVGSTDVCYTFADPAGNTVDCCFQITIIEVDTVPPNPNCPRDVARTTACNSGGTVEVTWQPATATDNSGTANLVSQSHRSGQSFFPVGQTTVTYTFSDPSNNRASCDFVVTVTEIDPVPPQCTNTPQDITREVSLGAGGTTINYNEPRATDDCGPATLQSRSHAPGEFFNTGRTSVIYIFVDGSGNTVSCAFNVQVNEVDRDPPVCECGEDITRTIPLPQVGGVGGTNIVFTECTATDNSGTVSLEDRSHTPGQRFTTGTTEVMYEFSDPSNNRVSCSFRITVIEVDDQPPVCIPTNDVTETIDLGQFGRTVTFPEPRATDNSGTANLQSSSPTPGVFFQVGSTDVCYTFADPAGNTVDCCFQITIIEVDTVPPNPNCPRDVARTTACNSGGTVEVTWQPATATDNSGTANLVSQSHRSGQSFFPVGQTTVTYTFSDPSNNRASCDFVVTVTEIDPVPPQCTNTPQDITREVPLGTGGTTINYNEPRATDDCGPATLQSRSHAPGDFFNTGRTSVTYIFVDGSGNTVSCAFNVQVNEVDRVPPVCECGEDITRTIPLPQGGGVGGTTVRFTECTATDNSGTVSREERSHAPGQRFTTGTTEVMYEFSDPSNNRVSCSFRITVIEVDDEPPVCIPSNDVTETIDLGQFGRTVTFPEPRATDNSGTANLQSRSHTPGAFFQVGPTDVCYTFADQAGNTVDCCFQITIIEVDTVPPNPNCPRDVARTTACNSGGTVDVTWQPATATDNSGTATLVSQSHRSGQSFFPVGQTTVTYTFSDPSSNRASCDFVVTVTEIDPVPPQCTNTPQDITREVPLGTGGTTVNYNEPIATDDCGPATLQSRSHAPGDFFNTGRTSVTYTFVDGSGNTVSCAFNVQVNEGRFTTCILHRY